MFEFQHKGSIFRLENQKMILTRAFCLGEERQHITEAQLSARPKNEFSRFWARAKVKDLPSIIKLKAAELSSNLSCDRPSRICLVMLSLEA